MEHRMWVRKLRFTNNIQKIQLKLLIGSLKKVGHMCTFILLVYLLIYVDYFERIRQITIAINIENVVVSDSCLEHDEIKDL